MVSDVDTVEKRVVAYAAEDKDKNLDVDQDCGFRRRETQDNKKTQR